MSELSDAVVVTINENFDEAMKKIRHCLDQLNDEQIWWRPQEGMNSIGNLLLHLSGNVTQWIMAGIGGEPDNRDRPGEFSADGVMNKSELIDRLQNTVNVAKQTLNEVPESELLSPRKIQAFETHVLGAALHVVSHFHGHMQEIIWLTRSQLGADYSFEWAPKTPEQGA